MGFIQKIRTRVHLYLLEKKLEEVNHTPQAVNYAGAKFAGILFDATNPENVVAVEKYAARLKADGKKVELLGFFRKRKVEGESRFPYFTLKGISLFDIPDSEVLATANKPFDLLISLHNDTCLPLEYISALSKAKCRVGRYIKSKTWCYDLMAYVEEGKPVAELIKQTDYLLNEINKNATV